MDAQLEIAAQQLARMRGMDAAYHRRFFADIWFTAVLALSLFVLGTAVSPLIFLAVPPLILLGANQTAFDASYLIFSRHYAQRLEVVINKAIGEEILLAHRMEDAYLFPLSTRKIVTVPLQSAPTWFGFMTVFYSLLGASVYCLGLVLGLGGLDGSTLAVAGYLVVLGFLTFASLAFGGWWFLGGAGERRLERALDGFAN